jgi:hypothetical protein
MSSLPTKSTRTVRLGRFEVRLVDFARNWVIVGATAISAAALFAGRASDGTHDFGRGMASVLAAFGGPASFGALLGALLTVVLTMFGLDYMSGHRYTPAEEVRRRVHIGIGIAVLVVAAVSGVKWIGLPEGGQIPLIFLGLVTAATLLTTYRRVVRP